MEYQALGFHCYESFWYCGLEITEPKNSSQQVPFSALGIHLENLFSHTEPQRYSTSRALFFSYDPNMQLKCLASISSISFQKSIIHYLFMTSSAKNKNMTKKNLKHLGDGFPWIFTEPKNCYWWFPMNSGHGTVKLPQWEFKSWGLEYGILLY